jgi:hypothetical protein
VDVGAGVKILGPITIGDDVSIGECDFPHGYCGKLDRRRHPGAHSSAQRSRCRNLDSVAPPEPIDR